MEPIENLIPISFDFTHIASYPTLTMLLFFFNGGIEMRLSLNGKRWWETAGKEIWPGWEWKSGFFPSPLSLPSTRPRHAMGGGGKRESSWGFMTPLPSSVLVLWPKYDHRPGLGPHHRPLNYSNRKLISSLFIYGTLRLPKQDANKHSPNNRNIRRLHTKPL